MNYVVGLSDKELVASKEILEEVFNEKELVVMYRAHLEIEKAKKDQRERGRSSGVSSPPLGEEGMIVLLFIEDVKNFIY